MAKSTKSEVVKTTEAPSFYDIMAKGKNVLVCTVTHYYIGTIVDIEEAWMLLWPVAWVADTGRLNAGLVQGTLSEYEEIPDGAVIFRGSGVSVTPWRHAVPAGVK